MKQIPNFPGYCATKDGRIWSAPKNGNCKKGRFLKSAISNIGYLRVVLCRYKKRCNCSVHRLVLETFVGPCPDGMEACHNNGVKTDNKLKNLRWDTRSNNAKDSVAHGTCSGLKQQGEKHPLSKLKEQDARMIIYMYRTKEFTQQEIADIYNVCIANINGIINKKSWKHIWSKK